MKRAAIEVDELLASYLTAGRQAGAIARVVVKGA